MKRAKHNGIGGFSLIEVVAAITILGLVVVPVGSSLVLSCRLSARSEELMQAQLAVTNAVETLMAEGIGISDPDPAAFSGVEITVTRDGVTPGCAYPVEVKSGSVIVETHIRPAASEGEPS